MSTFKAQQILEFLQANGPASSTEIHHSCGFEGSLATLKRELQKLLAEQMVSTTGRGKSTKYTVSDIWKLLAPIDVESYFKQEVDERIIKNRFNLAIIQDTLPHCALFKKDEIQELEELHQKFRQTVSELSTAEYLLAFERLAIDLSWKSSQIEGNTYSLLETELLLKEKEHAKGKSREEATMLLNHKAALDVLLATPDYLATISVSKIESIHALLVAELPIDRNLRRKRVGITGTNYVPLDNEFQIKEALEASCLLINAKSNPLEKALLTLVLLSYIQPFMDGNKRTARIVSNGILMSHGYCPLSFRTVDSLAYKKAMLLFYEQNTLSAFKQIFLDQYKFALSTYF